MITIRDWACPLQDTNFKIFYLVIFKFVVSISIRSSWQYSLPTNEPMKTTLPFLRHKITNSIMGVSCRWERIRRNKILSLNQDLFVMFYSFPCKERFGYLDVLHTWSINFSIWKIFFSRAIIADRGESTQYSYRSQQFGRRESRLFSIHTYLHCPQELIGQNVYQDGIWTNNDKRLRRCLLRHGTRCAPVMGRHQNHS